MRLRAKLIILIFLCVFSMHNLQALDIGLLLDQSIDINAQSADFSERRYEYSGTIIPRVSALLGDNGEFVFSAGFNYRTRLVFDNAVNIEPVNIVPELLRTDLTMRFGMSELKIGRMPYRDPLGIIADGFFDGASFSHDTNIGTFSAGGWYTGLLYKTRANITMTEEELQYFYRKLDLNDFEKTYFAPSRFFASAGWEHPSIADLFSVRLAVLGQVDMEGTNLNSQYLTAKFTFPSSYIILDAGGCLELIQYSQELTIAMAANAGLTFILPAGNEQHLTLRGIYLSGIIPDTQVGAFLPLTTIPQGNLLKVNPSGLTVIQLSYLAHLHRVFSANLSASYFIRNDLYTYSNYPVIGVSSDGLFLGTELYMRFIWSMSTGIQMNIGGGTFLPSLGDAVPDADMLWRAELNIVISIF
ncbi:MAG: hypothetical protein FWD40_03315 [Treponema sp.]|nr:hypothetical protein [Treponema sp.]